MIERQPQAPPSVRARSMSDPQPARRSGVPLLEVGVVGLALVGIAVFIWWGLEKSRETARRGVAKAELKERGFTLDSESITDVLQISGQGEIDNKTLNLLCVFETAGPLTLSLEDSWLNAKQLERLSVLKNLKALVIDGSRLTDDDLALLSSFPNLEYLSLRQSLIRGPGLQHLQELQKLLYLNLEYNELTDDCREHLLKLSPDMAMVLNKSCG
jgi:hypothetical protein